MVLEFGLVSLFPVDISYQITSETLLGISCLLVEVSQLIYHYM